MLDVRSVRPTERVRERERKEEEEEGERGREREKVTFSGCCAWWGLCCTTHNMRQTQVKSSFTSNKDRQRQVQQLLVLSGLSESDPFSCLNF